MLYDIITAVKNEGGKYKMKKERVIIDDTIRINLEKITWGDRKLIRKMVTGNKGMVVCHGNRTKGYFLFTDLPVSMVKKPEQIKLSRIKYVDDERLVSYNVQSLKSGRSLGMLQSTKHEK